MYMYYCNCNFPMQLAQISIKTTILSFLVSVCIYACMYVYMYVCMYVCGFFKKLKLLLTYHKGSWLGSRPHIYNYT